jgi:hypothetical protein
MGNRSYHRFRQKEDGEPKMASDADEQPNGLIIGLLLLYVGRAITSLLLILTTICGHIDLLLLAGFLFLIWPGTVQAEVALSAIFNGYICRQGDQFGNIAPTSLYTLLFKPIGEKYIVLIPLESFGCV